MDADGCRRAPLNKEKKEVEGHSPGLVRALSAGAAPLDDRERAQFETGPEVGMGGTVGNNGTHLGTWQATPPPAIDSTYRASLTRKIEPV